MGGLDLPHEQQQRIKRAPGSLALTRARRLNHKGGRLGVQPFSPIIWPNRTALVAR